MRPAAALVVGTVLCAGLAGCASVVPGAATFGPVVSSDRSLVDAYVAAANRAGEAGPQEQVSFLRSTQAEGTPFPPDRCFGELTLDTSLVGRTLRPDPGWAPPASVGTTARPQGAIYVAAAAVSVRQGALEIREDVGSKHFVVRDGRVTSYAPCAN